jgi:3-methyladenine DNA glycosylase Mpg
VTPLPRAICPACGRDVALRVRDKLREHIPTHGPLRVCEASGLTVDEARKAVEIANGERES